MDHTDESQSPKIFGKFTQRDRHSTDIEPWDSISDNFWSCNSGDNTVFLDATASSHSLNTTFEVEPTTVILNPNFSKPTEIMATKDFPAQSNLTKHEGGKVFFEQNFNTPKTLSMVNAFSGLKISSPITEGTKESFGSQEPTPILITTGEVEMLSAESAASSTDVQGLNQSVSSGASGNTNGSWTTSSTPCSSLSFASTSVCRRIQLPNSKPKLKPTNIPVPIRRTWNVRKPLRQTNQGENKNGNHTV